MKQHRIEREQPGSGSSIAFAGFASPSSNTTYTPNQFFDVCLPHRSRGCVRIVAYMLRKTLGWSDENGNPLREQFTFTYDELNKSAGVSREMIKSAIDEAVEFGFIRCLIAPTPNRSGVRGTSGLYELRWDESADYVKDPAAFKGFFAGEGHRTYIPNQYFDVVVRREPLMITKVVGTVIRFSIGFATKWGHRRQQVPISLTDIQRYAKIANRHKLIEALREAVSNRYLVQVEAGFFDRNAGMTSRSSIYAIKWLNHNADSMNGQKRLPESNPASERSEKVTGNGQKRTPEERSEKVTGTEITNTNNNLKQQRIDADDRDDAKSVAVCFETLKREGFDTSTAQRFAKAFSIQRVLNQIEWLPLRGASRNRLGLLRRAIEQDWPKPSTVNRTGDGESDRDSQYGQPYWNKVEEDRRRLAYKLKLQNQ